jgi:chemotaxis signal transduction protein
MLRCPSWAQTRRPLADKPYVQAQTGQYLTFRVARIDFALDASHLRGILPSRDLEPVAPSPRLSRLFGEWTCGFVSIRGRDVPVVDLRGQLNLPHGTHGRHPCIIVVEIASAEGPRLAGFIADGVAKVIHARERDFLHGKLRFGGRSLRLFDPDVLLTSAPAPADEEHPAEVAQTS